MDITYILISATQYCGHHGHKQTRQRGMAALGINVIWVARENTDISPSSAEFRVSFCWWESNTIGFGVHIPDLSSTLG